MSCMPTQMPRNGRPPATACSIACRMPGTAASPVAQSRKAPWPGSTTRSAAATASGSAVIDDGSASMPARSAASGQRARRGGEIAAAVIDHRDPHHRELLDEARGPRAASRRPSARILVARRQHVGQRVAAAGERPAHHVAAEQRLQPGEAEQGRGDAAGGGASATRQGDRRRDPASRRSRRDAASSQSGPNRNAAPAPALAQHDERRGAGLRCAV